MSQFFRLLSGMPVPIFGTARTATSWTVQKTKSIPRVAAWALPAVAGGMWFVWPAVSDEFKVSIGLQTDSEEEAEKLKKEMEEREAKQAAQVDIMGEQSKTAIAEKFKLDGIAKEKLEKAAREREQAIATGTLDVVAERTAEWDGFMIKSIQPGEDEDDDDEEDDEEDDDEDDLEEGGESDDDEIEGNVEDIGGGNNSDNTGNIEADDVTSDDKETVEPSISEPSTDDTGSTQRTAELGDSGEKLDVEEDDEKWFTC